MFNVRCVTLNCRKPMLGRCGWLRKFLLSMFTLLRSCDWLYGFIYQTKCLSICVASFSNSELSGSLKPLRFGLRPSEPHDLLKPNTQTIAEHQARHIYRILHG